MKIIEIFWKYMRILIFGARKLLCTRIVNYLRLTWNYDLMKDDHQSYYWYHMFFYFSTERDSLKSFSVDN